MFNLWDYIGDEFKKLLLESGIKAKRKIRNIPNDEKALIVRSSWLNINYFTICNREKRFEKSCWTWSTCAMLRHRNNWTQIFGFFCTENWKKSSSFILMRQNEFIFSPCAFTCGKENHVSNEIPFPDTLTNASLIRFNRQQF